jgi:peptide/nickel transport system substrate-binding protein
LFRYLLLIYFVVTLNADIVKPLIFNEDTSTSRIAPILHPGSHIKIFLPSIPYSYIAKNINSGLIRSSDNQKGWEYDLAKSHTRVDDLTYIFEIRKNLKFQDGSDFTVDSVVENLRFFNKYPFLYTNIDKVGFKVEKLSKYKIKIKLNKKYEMFFWDLQRIYFYTSKYLKDYAPKGAQTGSANKISGPYSMGPYILKSGYAVGKKQTPKLELIANPYYWKKNTPKIKKITVFTQLNMSNALEMVTKNEGQLDITPIPFNKKIDVFMSKYAKLNIKKSTNNFLIFFNLINGKKKLQNTNVRKALNEAIDQEKLLNFVYKKEGNISPFSTSINYEVVKKIATKNSYKKTMTQEQIKNLLNGLSLNVATQDRFMFLWKGIEYQLQKYGVRLNYTVTTSEKDIYDQLLNTRDSKNTKDWDILIWGDDDWYHKNPWTVFFIYENNSPWSTIPNDKLMGKYIDKFFKTKIGTSEYEDVVEQILNRAKDKAYTLRVPSPNKVIAINKEVIYNPNKSGIISLYDIQITNEHWSVRKNKKYPKQLELPIKTKREKNENNQ